MLYAYDLLGLNCFSESAFSFNAILNRTKNNFKMIFP